MMKRSRLSRYRKPIASVNVAGLYTRAIAIEADRSPCAAPRSARSRLASLVEL